MIALLDINLLIALFDAAHVHHQTAHAWMAKNRALGWATCPITQNGCIRVMSQSSYPGHLSVAEITRRLSSAAAVPEHIFWADSVSLCDTGRFEADRILTPRTLTDIYLLGLAQKNGGRLVTFDRAIPLAGVPKAKARHLVVLRDKS
ncbi:MAG: TA system VapC family ribonuclease toxin [Chthoniobacterales bacterium]